MSAAAARSARPVVRVAAPAGRTLRLVRARRSTAARAPFVAVVVLTLSAGLLALLLLNTVLAQDAFRLHLLQLQGRVVSDQEQGLQREVDSLQSPAVLAERAAALGMVPGGPPAFLRLSDGKVLGAAGPDAAAATSSAAAPAGPGGGIATTATAGAARTRTGPAAPAAGGWVLVPPGQPAPAGQPAGRPGAGPAGTTGAAPRPGTGTRHRTTPGTTTSTTNSTRASTRSPVSPATTTTTSGAHR